MDLNSDYYLSAPGKEPSSYKRFLPGERIADRYEVAELPLIGGQGIVYLCRDTREQAPVALKTFKPEFLPDRAARDRFLREGTAWLNFGHHPHIVEAYGVEYVGNTREVYLVLELVAKEERRKDASLRPWVSKSSPLPLEQALLFGLQIVRGMGYVTQVKPRFVHRDLKPENVLVGADRLSNANINRVRVTDFGLATVLQETVARFPDAMEMRDPIDLNRTQLTRGVVGTPKYMAPEQWQGKEPTLQTDIYAVGCIIYEMVAGWPAVAGWKKTELERAHCAGKIRPLPGELPRAVRDLILRCLAKEPEARYRSWGELETALGAAYEEVTGHTVPAPEPKKDWDRIRRVKKGWAFSKLGASYLDIGKPKVALDYFKQAREIGRREGDRRLEANGLNQQGLAHADLGDTRQAIGYYEQALAMWQETGDRREEGNVLNHLGTAHVALGNARQATVLYKRALAVALEISDQRGEANALLNLAEAQRILGNAKQVIGYYEQALSIYREIGDRLSEGTVLNDFGLAYADFGEVEQAKKCYKQALEIARKIGDRRGEGNALGNLGRAHLQLGNTKQAIETFRQALVIDREIGDRWGEVTDLGNLGAAYAESGNMRKASEYFELQLKVAQEIGDRQAEGLALGNLGNVYSTDEREWKRAIQYYEQALEIAKQIGDQDGEARHLLNMAALYARRGELRRALELAQRAVEIWERIGSPIVHQARRLVAQIEAMLW